MTWLIAFIVMLLVVAGMAVGVMAGRKPIAGSCGGIANLGLDKVCGICGNDFTKCENQNPDGPGANAKPLNSTEISRPNTRPNTRA